MQRCTKKRLQIPKGLKTMMLESRISDDIGNFFIHIISTTETNNDAQNQLA